MNKIKVLSEEVANRIAAGEVIERPVSVVKELVENSIDAGATKIIVTVENGGKKFIKVTDNGYGMTEYDALQSFERHATSKIRTIGDIFHISSLGFRGEALPSVASVSLLTMITRDAESEIATKIEFEAGRLKDVSKTSANIGTTIIVKKLFGNIPARKKFLKSEQVEFKHILNYLHYQAILYPQIHFVFVSNNSEKLNYPAVENTKKRMLAVFGSSFLKKDLIELDTEKIGMKISGYIGGLEEENSLLDFHYLFVNGRFIKDRIVYHSIRAAYEPFLKKYRVFNQGKNPSYILFLKLDPTQVDFNVHPAKLEIRFRDPGIVHNFVKTVLTDALLKYEENKFKSVKRKFSAADVSGKTTNLENKIFKQKTGKKKFSQYEQEVAAVFQPDIFQEEPEEPLSKPEIYLRPEEEIINPWQLHQSYIFVQVEDGLLVIDQHAAHERIIYEKILHRIHGAPAETQKLLFPIVIELPPFMRETVPELISENIDIFSKIGFSVKTFSGNSIVIDEIPLELSDWNGGDVFIEILKQLEEEFKETEDFRDSIAKSVSCKAAIKAGKRMTKKEMLTLINDLFACEVPYFCPHGRPLIIKMTMTEFEKRFKRIE